LKKTIRDNLFKILSSTIVRDATEELDGDDEDDDSVASGRALIGALFARAGKGKDEVIQILAREIGNAVAAMLREPLSQLAKNQKLQISFEFVPKNADTTGDLRDPEHEPQVSVAVKRRAKKPPTRKPTAKAAAAKRRPKAAIPAPASETEDDEQ
jgi:hypothetical protein